MLDEVEALGRLDKLGINRDEGLLLLKAAYVQLGIPHEPERGRIPTHHGGTAASAIAVRAGTEFEPLEGVLFRWPYDWGGVKSTIADSIGHTNAGGARAYVVVNNAANRDSAINYIAGRGFPTNNIVWILTSSNSVWMRDYGPQFAFQVGTTNTGIIDLRYYDTRRQDDAIPITLGRMAQLPTFQTGFYNEGGNINVDGLGTALMSNAINGKNPGMSSADIDAFFATYFGVTKRIVTERLQGEGTGHIDMWAKLLRPGRVMVGQYSSGQSNYQRLENVAAQLAAETDAQGNPFSVVRVPQPNVYYILFIFPVFRTYTNSLIVNDHVLVPTYRISQDAQALAIYQQEFPGSTVVGIDSKVIIESGGSIHCVTMEHPDPANGG